MKIINLTQNRFAKIDDEDYIRVAKYRWHCAYLGTKKYRKPYASTRHESKCLSMHRLVSCAPAGMFVDHIDGDTLNNQKSNLRICTRQQNNHNRTLNKNSTTGLKGVTKVRSKWRAQIRYTGQKVNLGNFETPLEAHKEYVHVAKQLFGDFARFE